MEGWKVGRLEGWKVGRLGIVSSNLPVHTSPIIEQPRKITGFDGQNSSGRQNLSYIALHIWQVSTLIMSYRPGSFSKEIWLTILVALADKSVKRKT